MTKIFKYLLFTVALIGTAGGVVRGVAQMVDNPVVWSDVVTEVAPGEYEVRFDAAIDAPWYMYDLGPYDMFPNATVFDFEGSEGVELVGKVEYGIEPTRKYDNIYEKEVGYFKGKASFVQRVKITGGDAVLKASVEFQVCNDESCLAPAEHFFAVPLKGAPASAAISSPAPSEPGTIAGSDPVVENARISTPIAPEGRSLWSMIMEAILWGFAALLTPCVFPMVPLTVSFFLRANEGKSRSRGRLMASAYGISIVALYTVPIALIIVLTRLAGGEVVAASVFNWFSTHWLPNIVFFAVFLIFAASLLGAFEIRLPGRLINKSGSGADKGGMAGIFFMALTLVLVSFSCTGPIVGAVLIESTRGHLWAPAATMLAFSAAFALPFAILAFFPALLDKIPRSGGWLNSVKVVLGFLELALGLKFLSVADQVYHWGILPREIYLALWITIFSLLGLYLLGKLRFKHDSEVKHVGVARLALAIAAFSFAVYMIPGMWGAPLKAISGYIPPQSVVETAGNSMETTDFEAGLRRAHTEGKRLMVYYTGYGCVNCREMEAKVLSDPEVAKLLDENYVVVSLYADDRTRLPEDRRIATPEGRVLKTVGAANSHFVIGRFGVNTQPAYIILDSDGNMTKPPRGYNTDVEAFIEFLSVEGE